MPKNVYPNHIVQIGCGVVGKAYVDAFLKKGNKVSIIEANKTLISNYKQQGYEIYHITDDLSSITNVDFIMISVFTPLVDESITMQYIYSTLPNVTNILRNSPNAIVLIRSTVKPLVTRDYRQKLEEELHHPVKVVFQPEFLRAKTAFDDAMNPWCVVFGISEDLDPNYLNKLVHFYQIFIEEDQIRIMSYEEAELLKLWHNTFNACKISFFNSCMMMANAIETKANVKINTDYVTSIMTKTCEGLMNPKYGTKVGHAYYGTCLPKDSAEMKWLEKEYNLPTRFMQSIVDVNDEIKKTDTKEILDGDNHVPFTTLQQISNIM